MKLIDTKMHRPDHSRKESCGLPSILRSCSCGAPDAYRRKRNVTYNPRSELASASMTVCLGGGGTNKYGFVFDNIGNRETFTLSTSSGQATNSETLTYLANALNQYTNIADGITNTPTYDLDGNLLTHNGWTYSWNGENRMVQASNATHVIEYSYDFMGRMFEKVVDGATNNLVWDGFNIISERLTVSTNHYVWGLDLSGSLQGAGGIGGLLAVTTSINSTASIFNAFSDANGNITEYVDATGTNVVAHREYSPFGVTIALTGTKKDDFTHWWSTKPWDPLTGMSEYEFRKYLVELGRWGSKDPIGENGGLNLYAMGLNAPLDMIDPQGLACSVTARDAGSRQLGSLTFRVVAEAYSDAAGQLARSGAPGLTFAHRDGTKVTATWSRMKPCACTFELHISSIPNSIININLSSRAKRIVKTHEQGHRTHHVRVAKKYASVLTGTRTCKYSRGEWLFNRSTTQSQEKCDRRAALLRKYLISQLHDYQHEVAEVMHNTNGSRYLTTSTLSGTEAAVVAGNAHIPGMTMEDWSCDETVSWFIW